MNGSFTMVTPLFQSPGGLDLLPPLCIGHGGRVSMEHYDCAHATTDDAKKGGSVQQLLAIKKQ